MGFFDQMLGAPGDDTPLAQAISWLQHSGLFSGDPEASGAAAASTAMQPVTQPYLNSILSGQRPPALPPDTYDPNRSFRANALDPQALAGAEGVAMGMGPGAIKAYHGSPHDFSRFDMSKIGTGEGAQAYGHGLYFAGNEGVARQYRDNVLNMPLIAANNSRMSEIARELDKWRKPGTMREFTDPRGDELAAEYDRLMAEKTASGKMYEVNINAEPHQLLDWDKPMSKQPHAVQAFERLGFSEPASTVSKGETFGGWGDTLGQDMYARLASMLGGSRQKVTPAGTYDLPYSNDPAASQQLRESGILGARYLDHGSRAAGEGSSNYVMYDDKLIDILRKYGLVGMAAPGALAAPYMISDSSWR